ncbi:xylose isomerase-like protein [Dendryphion nanum]|uniref:Apurinic-apyrimidinic endonuclease 1 n=1 Tax=Dendryphion nanum TaxID=256645 RepID=A0A9P9DA90_9PLEO|nr:xylose isomerase-like protein [Dendryphion nanum]
MARKIVSSSGESLSPPPDDIEVAVTTKAATNSRKRKAETTVSVTKRAKKATATKVEEHTIEEETKVQKGANGTTEVKKVQKRQTKKATHLAPLQQRTVDTKLRVGAHVSIAGGIQHSIPNVLHIGANAFALFLKNQRKWDNPPLDPAGATLFLDGCKKHGIDPGTCCLPHGSYLVNLAHPDEDRQKQAYESFSDDLKRCHELQIKLYNFHPGNSSATTREDGIRLIAENINKAHKDPAIGEVIPVLETMASHGNTIGGTFEDIADIIKLVEDKDRVGVCLDTCHVFAAGYDLRTPEAYAETMEKFDEVIGLKYLKAFHINDSKAPLASYRDLHARIGTGYLGLRAFHNIVNDPRHHGLPMVLETPIDILGENGKKIEDKSIWAREIKMLESLVGMDMDTDEFRKLESDLQEEGAGERERIGGQVERKNSKATVPKRTKAAAPKKRKSKKRAESDSDQEAED